MRVDYNVKFKKKGKKGGRDRCINPIYFKVHSSESYTNIRQQLHGHKESVISKSYKGSSHSLMNGNQPLLRQYGTADVYQAQ